MKEKQYFLIEDRTFCNEGIQTKYYGTEDEIFRWILNHTPFSNSEAFKNQGYKMLSDEDYKLMVLKNK
jgi:hypothetical protein